MTTNPQSQFDETVLEMIEHSPVGAVPQTPAYQDALKRLRSAHQIYADADHRDGYVTSRSLSRLPAFHAANLPALVKGEIEAEALEPNGAIFDRYVQSLSASLRQRAEAVRLQVAGRPIHHRAKGEAFKDPVHSLFLLPGSGPHPGLPGNYLYGVLTQLGADAKTARWAVIVHDNDDGAERFETDSRQEALDKVTELVESAPFRLDELAGLGFVAL